jgi:hypothetical protein
MNPSPEQMKTPDILEEYRTALMNIGRQQASNGPIDRALSRRADLLEEEISRRMAW